MQVENLGKLERRLSISVALAEVETEVDTRLKRLTRTVKMAGFRPGKVPLKVVAQQYGYQVQSEVLNEKIGNAFSQAVTENQLRVAGAPNIEPKAGAAATEGTVAFDATFEVYPEVKIGDLAGAEVEKVTADVADAEIDKTINILRKQRVHYHPKGVAGDHGDGGEAVAANGDRIVVDFIGTLDGTPFNGGTANDYAFVLGEGRMLPEFEAAAVGLRVGESKVFPLSFPEDYQGKDVAGKTAEFTITVKGIEWGHQPEVDAEFAQSLGIADGDLEKMRADIRSNLEREVKKRLQTRNKEAVMNILIAHSELDVPKALLESEVQRLMESTKNDMRQRGMKDDMPFPPELFQPQAERRVRLGLILAELVRAQDLKAKPEQIKAQVEDYAQSYENPAEVVRWYYADQNRLAEVEALVLEENVVNYVLGLVKVKETSVAFDELMANPAA
jgi:trigger factor